MENEFETVENFLYALRNAGSKFSLDRIKLICANLENPQENFPKIHVAGTNGKGSVCAMLESILRCSGLKVGMFTSPHLLYLGERIQINRVPISKQKLLEYVAKVRKVCDTLFDTSDIANYPSFFEFMTAVCFLYFADENVDVAVIEVGLGGRLDSTNVIEPVCSVITSVALDHTEYLGDTIEKIAREKAGIIKYKTPVAVGFLSENAKKEIAQVAVENKAPMFCAEDFFSTDLPTTSLEGGFQRKNASLAKLCSKILKGFGGVFANITEQSITNGLLNVSWKARWQRINLANGATLILDASHNPEGALALEQNLKVLVEKTGSKPIICVGVLGAERAKALLGVIAKYACEIVLLAPNQPRALSVDELEKLLPKGVKSRKAKVSEIFSQNKCVLATEGETVVSTGSIYLAGEVLQALGNGVCDGLSDII